MAYFRFRFVQFFKNHRSDHFLLTIAQNNQNLEIIFLKIRVWGQITNLGSFRVKFRTSLKGVNYISK